MFVVILISRFMESLKSTDFLVGKLILRYVSRERNYGIVYTFDSYFKVTRYIDNYFVCNIEDMKRTFGYVFIFCLGTVSWAPVKQSTMTLSSTEVAYVATTTSKCKTVWMRRILKELLHEQKEETHIFHDNKYAIALSRNHVFHKKSNHIYTRYHFIRELVSNNKRCMEFYRSKDDVADIFTKPLGKELFETQRESIGVCIMERHFDVIGNSFFFREIIKGENVTIIIPNTRHLPPSPHIAMSLRLPKVTIGILAPPYLIKHVTITTTCRNEREIPPHKIII